MKIYLNNDWLFATEFKEEYIFGNVDEGMVEVRIPHTTIKTPDARYVRKTF